MKLYGLTYRNKAVQKNSHTSGVRGVPADVADCFELLLGRNAIKEKAGRLRQESRKVIFCLFEHSEKFRIFHLRHLQYTCKGDKGKQKSPTQLGFVC